MGGPQSDLQRLVCRRANPRRAFTLVELLVVITIIGVLVGLLLPAVFAVQARAKQMQCLNNIGKQIGLALTNYESSHGEFPRNSGNCSTAGTPSTTGLVGSSTGSMASATTGTSWLTLILPNIDEGPLYAMINLNNPTAVATSADKSNGYNNYTAATTLVKTFVCPADTTRGTLTGSPYPTTNYKGVLGCNWVQNVDTTGAIYTYPDGSVSPLTGASGLQWAKGRNKNQADGVDNSNGIFCRGGPSNTPVITTTADIRDGLSKTLAVGETIPSFCGYAATSGFVSWTSWYWFEGSVGTCGLPINYKSGMVVSTSATAWQNNWGFMSRHSGGANFAMCDGSGQFLSQNIDPSVYRSLATIDGQETVSVP
jgi:prepilin-type N-terminal cleavage/methylation domain-containing protein/prepilin-type processing-associated H-X9-DG protein